MTVEFRLPDVGEGVAEGELVRWLVDPGDRVTEDQPVAEVETDKAVVEVPAPLNGTVAELRADPGDVVPVGDVLITFEEDGEGDTEDSGTDESAATAESEPAVDSEGDAPSEAGSAAAASENGAPTGDKRVFAPPRVRKLARELGVDIAGVSGSGPSGRVTEQDVRAAAEDGGEDAPVAESAGSDTRATEESAHAADPGEAVESALEGAGAEPVTGSAKPERDRPASAGAADRDRTLAAPATRKLAAELGVELNAVPASDLRGVEAVVSADAVREYARAQQEAQQADAAEVATGSASDREATAASVDASGERVEREPYRGIRKTIGDAMVRSKYTAPHVTHHDRLDATALVETREALAPLAEERGVKLTYLPVVMKAVVAALREHPVLNTSLDEEREEVVYKDYYNVGVATATDAGLMVPVVDSVDEKGLVELAAETRDLVAQARDRSIAREDMQGGTFTITNFGAVGGEYATPIINYPETAVLGLGELAQRPVVEGGTLSDPGEVVARPVLPLSLSIDHRVIDGAEAAAFVNTLAEYLQEPRRLLLD